jgi:cell division protein FtsW
MVLLMILTGLFILLSASMGLLIREEGSFSRTFFNQLAFGVGGGFILFLITSKINYKNWKKYSAPFFILSFILTALVFIKPFGFEHGGAIRWIELGPISFQPSEILKLAFVVYLSSWLASRKSEIQSFKFGLLPFLVMVGFVGIILIKQPDVGTLGVLVITSLFLFFLGGGKYSQIFSLIILGFLIFATLIAFEPYRMDRFKIFMDPSADPQGTGYQLKQSLIAIGSGGIFGRGFGMSVQKFNYLPEPIGDSIFSVFGEEFGFIGCVLLLALFLFFLYLGFRISIRAPDDFSRLLGAGIVILVITGVFVNIASMIGIVPLTGVPLIFISKGGSALAVSLAEMGILLNISKYNKK